MKHFNLYLIILTLSLFSSCNNDVEFVPYVSQFVVEGRIENGQYASVLLSTSTSFTESLSTDSLLNHAIRNAKVTISDGEDEEILLLKTNDKKIPPYEYVTREMKGRVNKHYYLKIEYYDQIISAETFIPPPVNIDSLWFITKTGNDSEGYIHIAFKNTSEYYYQISTREKNKDNFYTPCLYGNIDNSLYPTGESVSIQINKGPIIFPETNYNTSFPSDVPIEVKIATQTRASYNFWTSYQNEILNSQNPIFPSTNRLKSNIIGGVGIWAGYGTTTGIIQGF